MKIEDELQVYKNWAAWKKVLSERIDDLDQVMIKNREKGIENKSAKRQMKFNVALYKDLCEFLEQWKR